MDPAVFGYIRVSQAEGESGLATQRRILNESRAEGRPHLHRRGVGQEHAPPFMAGAPRDAQTRGHGGGPAD